MKLKNKIDTDEAYGNHIMVTMVTHLHVLGYTFNRFLEVLGVRSWASFSNAVKKNLRGIGFRTTFGIHESSLIWDLL